jgi:hypothetical protein
MSSLLRIAASRANGAKSRGPITPEGKLASAANSAKSTGPLTPEGKARSAQNALRHGILAESIVLDDESVDNFRAILAALQEELQPAPGIESRFIETMALAEWRRLRLLCLEKDQLTIEIRRQQALSGLNGEPAADATALAFRALADQSRVHELLNRYEARFDRQYEHALNALRAYRTARRKDEREARRAQNARKRENEKPKI